ncbi:HNH endonuclease family protein [Amycolatopsis suaedae]|uniref:HNH endonuclease n=1 Tax=Amycolatopsis suaedae TaxID=2510978 RepID=A0A4Q7JFS6_9PSEU|nr:HNH endonuclease family protein [Amycolatopsis suaedae]RZQ65464.1 HNH endonuclease [Amycolatopsis suaedae]
MVACATVSAAPAAVAEPPNIPDAATARTQLGALTVKPDGSSDGYDRDKFPHWSDQGNSCNTREVVLKRDGEGVQTGPDCAATSGKWFSPYDDATWSQASDVDIDHVVPLAAAWRTGASGWTTDKREQFANDLSDPQLIAVTDNVNQEKGDKSPDQWKPPVVGYWCTYARMWIAVKHKWQLTVSEPEKGALTDMLGRC